MKSMIVLALALVSASAYARPNTTDMTCREAAGLVQQAGAIVLSTGKSYLYDRFVAHSGFCGGGEKAAVAYVETLDNANCNVGFACVDARDGGNSVKYPSSIKSCKEGAQIWEGGGRGEGPAILRVCKNGKYVRADGKADPKPSYKGCEEGRKGVVTETDGDREYSYPAVCRNGKYVRLW